MKVVLPVRACPVVAGRSRLTVLAVAAVLAVSACGPAPSTPRVRPAPDPVDPAACLAPWTATARPSLAPLVDALRAGQVVILGEHHGDPAELALLEALVREARDQGVALDVAMELLPLRGTAGLARLATAWSDAGWWEVVGERYHPHPLQVAAYGEAVRGVMATGAPVHPLAPDCGPTDARPPQLEAAITCFSDRDRAMAAAVHDLRKPGRGLLISAGLWHGAALRPEGVPSLAALLEESLGEDVLQVLIMGAEGPDPEGPAGPPGTCGGLGVALAGEHAWTASLDQEPWRALPSSCVAGGAGLAPRLAGLFELVVVPPVSRSATTELLPDAAWAHIDEQRRAQWDLLGTALMDRAGLGTDPVAWARELRLRTPVSGAAVARSADVCLPLDRLGLDGADTRRP